MVILRSKMVFGVDFVGWWWYLFAAQKDTIILPAFQFKLYGQCCFYLTDILPDFLLFYLLLSQFLSFELKIDHLFEILTKRQKFGIFLLYFINFTTTSTKNEHEKEGGEEKNHQIEGPPLGVSNSPFGGQNHHQGS